MLCGMGAAVVLASDTAQELGDVENWAEHIEKDMNAVAAALEEIHSSKTGATQ